MTKPRALDAALRELNRARSPLFAELRELIKDPNYLRGEPAHTSCTRPKNQMRITPLEAESIARALKTLPELRRKVPAVLRRLRSELALLKDTTRRQSFTCPLLENGLCLVHHAAKPIGCLAWNPGRNYSDLDWHAFARRDALTDAAYGPRWSLRAIPLWLARVLVLPLKRRRTKRRTERSKKPGVLSRRSAGRWPAAEMGASDPARKRPSSGRR